MFHHDKFRRFQRLNMANLAQIATRSQAESAIECHKSYAVLARENPNRRAVELKIVECFEARIAELLRGN